MVNHSPQHTEPGKRLTRTPIIDDATGVSPRFCRPRRESVNTAMKCDLSMGCWSLV